MGEDTIFLAKMISPYLLVTGLGFFFSKNFYLRMLNDAESEHPISINLSGMVHFFIGMGVLLNHCRWGNHLEIVVTLLGFAFLLKGSMLIAVPEKIMGSNQTTKKVLPVAGIGFITMSLYLAWFSYF